MLPLLVPLDHLLAHFAFGGGPEAIDCMGTDLVPGDVLLAVGASYILFTIFIKLLLLSP